MKNNVILLNTPLNSIFCIPVATTFFDKNVLNVFKDRVSLINGFSPSTILTAIIYNRM